MLDTCSETVLFSHSLWSQERDATGSTGCVYSGLGLLIDDMVPAGAGVMQLFLKC